MLANRGGYAYIMESVRLEYEVDEQCQIHIWIYDIRHMICDISHIIYIWYLHFRLLETAS